MCYDERDYSLETFDGIKVSVMGRIGDEFWRIADVYIEDGSGIERLVNIMKSEEKEGWDGFSYGVTTVRSIGDVILEDLESRKAAALKSLFLDEYEYAHLSENDVNERIEGIAYMTGRAYRLRSEYMGLKYQVDESLVPEEKREFYSDYPSMFEYDRQLKRFREIVEENKKSNK